MAKKEAVAGFLHKIESGRNRICIDGVAKVLYFFLMISKAKMALWCKILFLFFECNLLGVEEMKLTYSYYCFV